MKHSNIVIVVVTVDVVDDWAVCEVVVGGCWNVSVVVKVIFLMSSLATSFLKPSL
jgi:hypothetical protein